MSAIPSDWASVATEALIERMAASGEVYLREEEFRSALNNNTAGCIADQQRRRAAATGSIGSAARSRCR